LGIQLHFVFDGRSQSEKKGKLWWDLGDVSIGILQKTLDHIGVPWHTALGTAEAECAAMQQRGIVDAVWSEDGREFAHGCEVLVHFKFSMNGKSTKSQTHFYLHRLTEISKRIPGLNREGFVLYTILSRADDEESGLDITPVIAINAAEAGLGTKLCNATENKLPEWRQDLIRFLRDSGSDLVLPDDFPKYEGVLENNSPRTSDADTLEKYRSDWEPVIKEEALKDFLIQNFDFSAEKYITWIVPIILVRSLLQTVKGQEAKNRPFKLEPYFPKASSKAPVKKSERLQVNFSLLAVTSLNMSNFPRKNEDRPLDTNPRFETLRIIYENSQYGVATIFNKIAPTSANTSFSESSTDNSSSPSHVGNKRKRTPENKPAPTETGGIKNRFATSKRQRTNSKAPTPESSRAPPSKGTSKENDTKAQLPKKAPVRNLPPPPAPRTNLGSSSNPIDLDSAPSSPSSHYDLEGFDDLSVTPLLQSSPMSSPPLILDDQSKEKELHENLYDAESTQSKSDDVPEAPLLEAAAKPLYDLPKSDEASSAKETAKRKAPDNFNDVDSRESSHYDSDEWPDDELLQLP
jgi:Holliday junction resolvase YEN1